MKIKSGYVLHSMRNEYVVVAIGKRTKEFRGIIRLNDTGAFLWEQLQADRTEQELQEALMERYGITEEVAKESVDTFAQKLIRANVVDV